MALYLIQHVSINCNIIGARSAVSSPLRVSPNDENVP